jgi:predicted enzyme related to lactoylglutathione lyase
MSSEGYLDYIELPAMDIAAAKKFYNMVLGWAFVDFGLAYAEFHSGERVGGFNSGGDVTERGEFPGVRASIFGIRTAPKSPCGRRNKPPRCRLPGGIADFAYIHYYIPP